MESRLRDEFIEMLKENKDEFYKLAYSYLKNEQDTLDALGESTYRAWRSLQDKKEMKYMKTWFYRIVMNESKRIFKKRTRFVCTDKIMEDNKGYEHIEDEMDLENAVNKLPSRYKDIIVLRYLRDMSIKDISEILEINENTAKTRINRGLKRLKKIIS